MTNPVFNFTGTTIDEETIARALLIMEVNETSFSYVILDENHKLLVAAYFVLGQAEGRNLADAIRDIVDTQEILQHDFRESVVVYNFSETTLVPGSVYNHEANRDLIELLFGNLKKGLVLSEKWDNAELHTLYRIPAAVHSLLQQKFSAGKYWHIYTLWLSLLEKSLPEETENIYLVFAADKVLTAIFKNNKLQLIQSFNYTTPEDVVYHLLHCCEKLSLSQDDCLLHISGYIDEDSALFNEIKKYFLRMEFDKVEETKEVKETGEDTAEDKVEEKVEETSTRNSGRDTGRKSDPIRISCTLFFLFAETGVMRIIGGQFGGRRLHPPSDMPYTRPTTDLAKEGLFNILQHQFSIEGSKTLDLFGGTGSITYELASRGATDLTIIEKDVTMYNFIRKTAETLQIKNLRLIKSDVFRFIQDSKEKYDFIFAGPPYALKNIDDLPRLVTEKDLLNAGGWFVLEHTPRNNYEGWPLFATMRNYGTTVFSFFVRK